MRLPDTVAHADWSVGPAKRWCAVAHRLGDGYEAGVPVPVHDPVALLERAAGRTRLLGLDLPIGVPASYAHAAGIASFPAWLCELGRPPWHELAAPAAHADEVSVHRPLYPAASAARGSTRAHLAAGLGVGHHDDLLRACERRGALARRPSSVFWVLGANQVGRAAVSAWLELLGPVRRGELAAVPVHLWPFDGPMASLLEREGTVVAETYPAQCAADIGAWPVVKSRRDGRCAVAAAILAAADRLGVTLTGEATAAVAGGFANDDAFDAFVGMLGLLHRLRAGELLDPPRSATAATTVEGWVVGAAPPR